MADEDLASKEGLIIRFIVQFLVTPMSFGFLSIINIPGIQGTGCNFQKDVICLQSGNLSNLGFPQYVTKILCIYSAFKFLCSGDSISFTSIHLASCR